MKESIIVAWDIETCPQPIESMTPAQQHRYEVELKRLREREPELDDATASSKTRSLHPFLGWICCISAMSGTLGGGHNEARSWTAATMEEEKAMLSSFWESIAGFPTRMLWVTFNGKRFDGPFLAARSLRHGIMPSRSDILYEYPFKHAPHADLSGAWQSVRYTLDEMSDFLGLETPKDAFDGSQVAGAVAEGRIAEVQRYCEGDVLATFECYRLMAHLMQG